MADRFCCRVLNIVTCRHQSTCMYVWGRGMADRFCCRVLNIMTCRHQSTCMYGEKVWLIGFVAVY